MTTVLLFISLVMHLAVIVSTYVVHTSIHGVLSKVERIVLGCVMFSAVAVLLGIFK